MKKALIVFGASLTVIVVACVALIGSALAWGGVGTVKVVEQSGTRITVPVPMAAVEAAAIAGDLVFDPEDHLDIDVDLGELGPFVRGLLEALDECPDVVLVDVVDGGDHVRVSKKNGSLLIEINDSDVEVRVSVPTRSVRRTVNRLLS